MNHEHRIIVRRDGEDRGLTALAILIGLGVWWWLHVSGDTFAVYTALQDREGLSRSSYGSVSYLLMTVVLKLISGLITAASLVFSGIWYVALDLFRGIQMVIADWRLRRQRNAETENAAIKFAANANATGDNAASNVSFDQKTTEEKLKAVAMDGRARISELRADMQAEFAKLADLIGNTQVLDTENVGEGNSPAVGSEDEPNA